MDSSSNSESSGSLNPIISSLVLGVDSFGWGEDFGNAFSGNTSATISGGGLGIFFSTTGALCGIAYDMVEGDTTIIDNFIK